MHAISFHLLMLTHIVNYCIREKTSQVGKSGVQSQFVIFNK
jgi:predicted ester cyclase